MAFPSFEFIPDFGASKSKKPSVTKIQFGDGYAQRIAYGINTSPETWGVNFSNRDQAEADAIDAFLEARGAVEPFSWTTPDGNEKNFTCEEWSRTIQNGSYYTISATFLECFDPE